MYIMNTGFYIVFLCEQMVLPRIDSQAPTLCCFSLGVPSPSKGKQEWAGQQERWPISQAPMALLPPLLSTLTCAAGLAIQGLSFFPFTLTLQCYSLPKHTYTKWSEIKFYWVKRQPRRSYFEFLNFWSIMYFSLPYSDCDICDRDT